MSETPQNAVPAVERAEPGSALQALRHELQDLKQHWWWLCVLGTSLVVLGSLAIGVPIFVSVATVIFLGAFLLVAGVAQVISAFWAGRWSGFLLQLLIGIFYVVVAILILDAPLESTLALTLLIAAFLIVTGIFRVVSALTLKFPGWGWQMLNGVITLLLGVLVTKVLAQDEATAGLWVIGLFVGIEMIFNGWTWIMLSLEIRNIPAEDAPTPAAASAESQSS